MAYLVPAAFGAGLVDSIAGGGGLVSLPALLAAGLPPQIAISTNKGQSTVGNAASFAAHWRLGNVDRQRAPVAFGAGLVGACLGATALLSMRPEPLRPLIAGLLVFAAVVVALRGAFRPVRLRRGSRSIRSSRSRSSVSCWASTTASSAPASGRCSSWRLPLHLETR